MTLEYIYLFKFFQALFLRLGVIVTLYVPALEYYVTEQHA